MNRRGGITKVDLEASHRPTTPPAATGSRPHQDHHHESHVNTDAGQEWNTKQSKDPNHRVLGPEYYNMLMVFGPEKILVLGSLDL